MRDQESEYYSLFTNAFDYAPYGMALVGLDGRFLKANPSFCQIIGYTEAELVNRTYSDFMHSDDLHKNAEYIEQLLAGEIDSYRVEKRVLHKSDYTVWVLFSGSLMVNEQKEPQFLIIQLLDITDWKESEKRYHSLAERFDLVSKNSQDIISLNNLDGSCLYISPAIHSILGYHPEQLIGKCIYELWHSDDVASFTAALHYSDEYTSTCRVRHNNGQYVWFETTMKIILAEKGDTRQVLGISRDITDRNRTQELLKASEKLNIVGQLAAGIAHEIRNPLTSLKGFLQLIISRSEGRKEHLQIMKDEINRIELIVTELLVLAKPQNEISLQKNNLLTLLQHVITLLDTQAIMNNIQIIPHFESNTLTIDCDDNQMKQVFINIIKNAIEAMPEGGEINIHAEQEKDHAIIRIIDQGCGIPEEMISRLGEPFYTTKEGGTGLGLMISNKIVENHQGTIHIISKKNEGTIFRIQLPVAERGEGNDFP
ncbi:PAS domain-containing sensor histidine kinase [Paenibacillus harenae]|uniref:PAS domain-containing sensor histidine kinase n=1 Tax=Paenibacillus harenae TaxID=306543 RepID=UPI00042A53F6|nr:PAS domain S-box protein [Paenibacillus harenae]